MASGVVLSIGEVVPSLDGVPVEVDDDEIIVSLVSPPCVVSTNVVPQTGVVASAKVVPEDVTTKDVPYVVPEDVRSSNVVPADVKSPDVVPADVKSS